MVFRRTYRRRRRPPHHRRKLRMPNVAVRPRFMPHAMKMARVQNVSSKVFYLKSNGQIQQNATGTYQFNYNSRDLLASPPTGLADIFSLYEEYKCLAVYVKFFAANVGTEPFTLSRGDCVVWTDQRAPFQTPTSIGQIINYGSARMLAPRQSYSRKMFRTKGNPEWGNTQIGTPQLVPDSWNAQISICGFNATPLAPPFPIPPPVMWYYTVTYKVVVRGRRP